MDKYILQHRKYVTWCADGEVEALLLLRYQSESGALVNPVRGMQARAGHHHVEVLTHRITQILQRARNFDFRTHFLSEAYM